MNKGILTFIGLYLIAIAVVGLGMTGCFRSSTIAGPKFQVGDCLVPKVTESWEENDLSKYSKILEVGKEKYLYAFLSKDGADAYTTDYSIYFMDEYRRKVPCPKAFNGIGGQYEE